MTFKNGKGGDIFVQKAPATTIKLLADTLIKIFGKSNYNIKIIGTRHGEKLYEIIINQRKKW